MKSPSVINRVTLFYACVLFTLTLVICAFLYITAELQAQSISEETLETTVKSSVEDITQYEDHIEIEPSFNFYKNGVAIVLYGAAGTPLAGTTPASFIAETPLMSDNLRRVSSQSEVWLVYDLFIRHPATKGIWIRGIYSFNSSHLLLQSITRVAFIALPVFLLLAIFTGYGITKKAFQPLKNIHDTASSIQSGNDLSRRITLHEPKDEFYELSALLNHMIGRLELAFESERQFSSDVSHELRTPIAVILSQCEYAFTKLEDPALSEECLQGIQDQAQRMSRLVSQLLELSRNLDAKSLLNIEPIALNELCEDVAEQLASAAAKKDIRLLLDICDVTAEVDQTQIIRLLLNLVSNAIQYGKEHGFVKIRLMQNSENAILAVSDDGIGIQPENLDKVFRRFYKEDSSRSSHEGFGFGLSYVQWITQAHGGTISVQSEAGIGTTFTVYLPLRSQSNR